MLLGLHCVQRDNCFIWLQLLELALVFMTSAVPSDLAAQRCVGVARSLKLLHGDDA